MTPTEIGQCYHWGYIPMAAVGGMDLNNIQDFFKADFCFVEIGGNIVNKK